MQLRFFFYKLSRILQQQQKSVSWPAKKNKFHEKNLCLELVFNLSSSLIISGYNYKYIIKYKMYSIKLYLL